MTNIIYFVYLGHFVLLTAVLLNGHVGVYGQQQSYAVMAPNTIRPNIDYLAAVTVLNIGGELQVCFIFCVSRDPSLGNYYI